MEPKKTMQIDSEKIDFYNPLISDYIKGRFKYQTDWEYSRSALLNRLDNRPYDSSTRAIVADVLKQQYEGLDLTPEETASLTAFSNANTVTITTGHQLILLGGPMYFYTKIANVIALCEELSSEEKQVVPIFWMASEDHDFEEIAKVNLFGKSVVCEGKNAGPVGRIEGAYFKAFLNEVTTVLGDRAQFNEIKEIITIAFNEGKNLSEITKLFVRALFKDKGLLIIDADDAQLKSLFNPIVKQELREQTSFTAANKQIEVLSISDYKIQVNPREINLFYIQDGYRQRIVTIDSGFQTVDQRFSWSSEEIEIEVDQHPENFSPNVILRPVYQEVLLPNIAYVGGAGEIAYWLELPQVFKAYGVYFPMPIVRKSYYFIPQKHIDWLQEYQLDITSVFENQDVLINRFTKQISDESVSLSTEIASVKKVYQGLLEKGMSINPQLEKVVLGDEKRTVSALENVEKRFLNAEKQKHEQTINKLKNIINKVQPNGVPMERVDSYIPMLVNPEFNLFQCVSNNNIDFTTEITFAFY